MKFNFSVRKCQFGTFNNRNEFDGPEDRVKAIDLPMTFSVRRNELDMLVPVDDDTGPLFSDLLFSEKHVRVFVIAPLKIYRKPEDVHLTIMYGTDGPKAKEYTLEFKDVTIKDPVLHVSIEDGTLSLTCKAQIHPGRYLQAIVDNVETQVCRFKCRSVKEELLDKDQPAEPETGAPPPEQAQLPGTQPARPGVPEDNADLGAIEGQDDEGGDEEDDEDDDE